MRLLELPTQVVAAAVAVVMYLVSMAKMAARVES
jgi:hypothetical protein